jgi:ribosomal protein S10
MASNNVWNWLNRMDKREREGEIKNRTKKIKRLISRQVNTQKKKIDETVVNRFSWVEHYQIDDNGCVRFPHAITSIITWKRFSRQEKIWSNFNKHVDRRILFLLNVRQIFFQSSQLFIVKTISLLCMWKLARIFSSEIHRVFVCLFLFQAFFRRVYSW